MVLFDFLIRSVNAQVELPTFQEENLPDFISSVYSFALAIVGILVFVRLLWAGFMLLTAAGNVSKISDAKDKLKNAVIGVILLVSAYLILYVINPDLVKNTFNFELFRNLTR